MNGRELLLAMGSVDEIYVEEAENLKVSRKRVPWVPLVSLAACLCLVISAAHYVSQDNAANESFSESDRIESAMESDQSLVMRYVEVCIDSVTEYGFTATVTDPVEDDLFTMGMTVYVVAQPDAGEYTRGDLLKVWFLEFDPSTQTITAEKLTGAQ